MSRIRASDDHTQRVLQACVDGDISYVQSVSEEALNEARCSSGCTALHWAAGSNQIDVVNYLLSSEGLQFSVDMAVTTRQARGRTPLHYACRNGHLEAVRLLVETYGAQLNVEAKHGVTPFQLAVWQNQLHVCQWLVWDVGVDPSQTNDFACGAVHWLGICPVNRATVRDDDNKSKRDGDEHEDTGAALLPMARWLESFPTISFRQCQKQGHTALHKAAWGGHLALIQYLHQHLDMWDDKTDGAGNYAADLADMAHTVRHDVCARYLRTAASGLRRESSRILNVALSVSPADIRKAYLAKAKLLHPDKRQREKDDDFSFVQLRRAYDYLQREDTSTGPHQRNPSHSLYLMLQVSKSSGIDSEGRAIAPQENIGTGMDDFKARLISVLLEYGNKGLDLSNVKKKWNQVWPDQPFPSMVDPRNGRKRETILPLSDFIRKHAGDVVDIVVSDDRTGCMRVVPKHCTRAHVVAAHHAALRERRDR